MVDLNDITEKYNPVLKYDGFDEAIVGIAKRHNDLWSLVYDSDKCISMIQEWSEPSDDPYEDYCSALEYFDFNMACAYIGDTTPLFLTADLDQECLSEEIRSENIEINLGKIALDPCVGYKLLVDSEEVGRKRGNTNILEFYAANPDVLEYIKIDKEQEH